MLAARLPQSTKRKKKKGKRYESFDVGLPFGHICPNIGVMILYCTMLPYMSS